MGGRRFLIMTTKKKNTKGADAGTQFSHWTKNPHETPTTDDARKKKLPSGTKVRSTQASVNAAAKKAIDKINRTEEFKKKTQSTPVYTADFSQIDGTIEEIKKETRKYNVSEYSSGNILNALRTALRGIRESHH
jgi:predicted DNA-binding helix-hairpin-helix protein